jgi:hypothetical protein
LGKDAAAPQRRARRAPHPPARALAALGVRAHSPPDVPPYPRLIASLGYAPAKAACAPRSAGVRAAPRAGRTRSPFGPAVHRRPPARVRRATAASQAAVTSRPAGPYLNAALSPSARQPSRRPPLPLPPVSLQLHSLPPPADRPTLSPRTRRTSQSRILSSVRFSSPEPRAAAAAVAGHRQTPTPTTPPPEPRPSTHPR